MNTIIARLPQIPALLAVASLLLLPAAALATGTPGEHVNDLGAHIGEYEDDVRSLMATADGLVSDYAPDEDMSGRLGELVQQWERVKLHGAVEARATPLYGPIWAAIGGLRRAVENGAPKDEVRKRRDALERALWQSLGAVKLAASSGGRAGGKTKHGEAEHGDGADVSTTVNRIGEDLNTAAVRYGDGEVAEAKVLIQETYLQRFEGLEGELIERDPELVAELEEAFNATLPGLMDDGAPQSEVRARVAEIQAKLEKVEEILVSTEKDQEDVF